MQYRNRTIELIAPAALATMIDEYAIFGPKLGDCLPSFFGVSLSEHLVEIAFDEDLYGIRHRLSRIVGFHAHLLCQPPRGSVRNAARSSSTNTAGCSKAAKATGRSRRCVERSVAKLS